MADVVTRSVLLVRSRNQRFALPIGSVVEVMRPLPLEPLEGAPAFVCGLSIVRGAPVPVLDLDRLFDAPVAEKGRLVILRVGERLVGLAVSEVLDLREFSDAELRPMPPLLSEAFSGYVAQLGQLDGALCMVLESARLLPEVAGIDAR